MKLVNDRVDLLTNIAAAGLTAALFGLFSVHIAPPPPAPELVQTVDLSLEAAPEPAAPPPPPPAAFEPPPPPPPEPPPLVTDAVPPTVAPPPPPPPKPVTPPKPTPPKPLPPRPVTPRADVPPSDAAPSESQANAAPAKSAPSAAPQASAANAGAEESYVGQLRAYYRSISKYPTSKEARTMKPHGSVVVRFTLTRDGEVRDVQIERPSPVMVLNQQALSTVRGGNPPRMPAQAWGNTSEHVFTVTLDYEPS